jgi:hypothetical protein
MNDDVQPRPTVDNGPFDAVSERLRRTYVSKESGITDDDVSSAVHDAAAHLRNARVQTFVPLLAENMARDRLNEQRQPSLTRGRTEASTQDQDVGEDSVSVAWRVSESPLRLTAISMASPGSY